MSSEPQTKAGQAMEKWLRESEDYEWGRKVTDAILAIEAEATTSAVDDALRLLADLAQSAYVIAEGACFDRLMRWVRSRTDAALAQQPQPTVGEPAAWP